MNHGRITSGRIRWRFSPFYLFIVLMMVGSSNMVNLTDGLDGLASGLMVIASGAMTALTYVSSQVRWADYLGLAICRPRRN